MDYSILRYGAVADGVTNCAAAIQQAVDAIGNRLFKILSNSVIQTSSFSRHALRNAFLLAYQNTPFVRR